MLSSYEHGSQSNPKLLVQLKARHSQQQRSCCWQLWALLALAGASRGA